ncbi:RNA-directed DNA polymerase from mobile element jockey [Eumeta japonica]|uniref:RNA-directed DNA polymerase from mobile element jockey n=1 Tax=Eumeta variegata TaxID=151549 RepID=A0A4C2A0X4_EUMVA|nr:RNA-directed DNA polymerase from mobile element jockey [Eumeta japonica]
MYEKILKTRLSEHLFGKGLIINEQFGFIPNRSCPQQALRLVEYITEGFKTQKRTVAVFFDVAKAFDRVWHAGLIHKLYLLKVPDRLILIIHNYLTDRHFVFKHENTHSSRRMIRAGVPQGSALCPLLYSVYTNDIPRSPSGVQLALFADDTALYLRGQTERSICPHLQKAIEELARWFQIWRIEVNAEKSAAISFIYREGRSPEVVARGTPSLRINNAPIPWTVLTYASPVFAHAAPKTLKKLQLLQNKFCRTATNAHWCVKNSVLHRDLDLSSIRKYMKDASERFFSIAKIAPESATFSSSLLRGATSLSFYPDFLCRRDLIVIPHMASHAPSTPPCVVRPRKAKLNRIPANSIAEPFMFSSGGLFLVGFSSTLPTRTGARENHIEGINTYSLHPGVIPTGLTRHLDDTVGRGARLVTNLFMRTFHKTVSQGAQTTIYCAVDEKCANETGLYYSDCDVATPAAAALDDEVAKKLWSVSVELVGLQNYDPFTAIDAETKHRIAKL